MPLLMNSTRPSNSFLLKHFHDYPPVSGGGLARYVCDFAELLSDYEHQIISSRLIDHFGNDIAISTRTRHGDFAEDARSISIYHLTHSMRSSYRYYRSSKNRHRSVVVLHTDVSYCDYNRLSRLEAKNRDAIIRKFYADISEARYLVCFSAKQFEDATKLGCRNAIRLPMPINFANFPIPIYRNSCSEERLHIAAFGEASYAKGFDRLLKLAGAAPKDVAISSYGAGPMFRHGAHAESHNFKAHPTIPYESALRRMSEIDILLAPSRSEGWGRVIIEALFLGRPIIYIEATGILSEWDGGHTYQYADLIDRTDGLSSLPLLNMTSVFGEKERIAVRKTIGKRNILLLAQWRELIKTITVEQGGTIS